MDGNENRIICAKKVERLNTTSKIFLNWNMVFAALAVHLEFSF